MGSLEQCFRVFKLIKRGDYQFPVWISDDAEQLVRKLLVLEPPQRLSIPEILTHPWVKEEDSDESDDESDLQTGVSMSRDQISSSFKSANQTEEMKANINVINVDNMFFDEWEEKYKVKLSYDDYCALTQDFYTYWIDEEAIKVMETFGFTR